MQAITHKFILKGDIMKLHYLKDEFDLKQLSGQGLIDLFNDITNDLLHFTCFNRDEDVDDANIALDELLEYIVFNRGGIE